MWDFEPNDEEHLLAGARFEEIAYRAIPELLTREHAAVWAEIEAKLAEQPHPEAPKGLNPHILTRARRRLVEDDVIEQLTGVTRGGAGGREISTYVLKSRYLKGEVVRKAAARKRLLQSRYLGWAKGSSSHPNLIGTAGEQVTHASLRAATANGAGYQLLNPERGEVKSLFGQPVPGGSLDNAAHLVTQREGNLVVVTVIVEVKNLRQWIYPNAPEIFQLLEKAARLQIAHPRNSFMPVLIARNVHHLTYVMAEHLGFFVTHFDGSEQPILPHWTAAPDKVLEVRSELGYALTRSNGAFPFLARQFERTIPRVAGATAARWTMIAPHLSDSFTALRSETLRAAARQNALDRLFAEASALVQPTARNNWRRLH